MTDVTRPHALIYGSREWPHGNAVRYLVAGLVEHWGSRLVIVCGLAKAGADNWGRTWAEHYGATLDGHAARWMEHDREGATAVPCRCPVEGRSDSRTGGLRHDCPLAGYRRNQEMADVLTAVDDAGKAGAVAFGFRCPGKSNGTDDMTERLEAAGIPVLVSLASAGHRGSTGARALWPLMDQRPLMRNRRVSQARRLHEPRPARTLLDIAEDHERGDHDDD